MIVLLAQRRATGYDAASPIANRQALFYTILRSYDRLLPPPFCFWPLSLPVRSQKIRLTRLFSGHLVTITLPTVSYASGQAARHVTGWRPVEDQAALGACAPVARSSSGLVGL
jgi:hypothetical protein